MKKRRKQPGTIERSLWHGTSADAIGNINNGGFNRSYCGKNGSYHGSSVCQSKHPRSEHWTYNLMLFWNSCLC